MRTRTQVETSFLVADAPVIGNGNAVRGQRENEVTMAAKGGYVGLLGRLVAVAVAVAVG